MKDFELLDKLTTAYKENNKDEFTRLCCSDCQNGSDYNNFHSLYVLRSHITENDDTFIEHLNRCVKDEERPLLEQFIKTNYHYNFEYYDIDEDNVETARDLYNKYEEELDTVLIWDNAKKIINDLIPYLTEIEQYQFALKNLEDAKTPDEFFKACDNDRSGMDNYPLCCKLYTKELYIYGIDYSIHLQPGEIEAYIKDHYPDTYCQKWKAMADYLFAHAQDIIEEVKATIKELENDERNEEEFDVNARHDDWDFFEAV